MAAQANRKVNFVGLDFYHKGIRKVITRINKLQIKNIRIIYGDAREKTPLYFRRCRTWIPDLHQFPLIPGPKNAITNVRLIKPPLCRNNNP